MQLRFHGSSSSGMSADIVTLAAGTKIKLNGVPTTLKSEASLADTGGTTSLYRVKWFCHINWKTFDLTVLATSPGQIRAWVDQQTKPEFREKIHRLRGEPVEDSLTIELEGVVEMPFCVTDHD